MPKPGALEMTTREFQFRAWGSEKRVMADVRRRNMNNWEPMEFGIGWTTDEGSFFIKLSEIKNDRAEIIEQLNSMKLLDWHIMSPIS